MEPHALSEKGGASYTPAPPRAGLQEEGCSCHSLLAHLAQQWGGRRPLCTLVPLPRPVSQGLNVGVRAAVPVETAGRLQREMLQAGPSLLHVCVQDDLF